MKSPTTPWSKTQWLGTRRCNTAGLTTLTWPLCPTRLRVEKYWHLINLQMHGLVSTDILGPSGLTEVVPLSWIGDQANQTTMEAPLLHVVSKCRSAQGIFLMRNVASCVTSPAREILGNAQPSRSRSALKQTWRILRWDGRFWNRYGAELILFSQIWYTYSLVLWKQFISFNLRCRPTPVI